MESEGVQTENAVQSPPEAAGLGDAIRFVRHRWLVLAGISALLLVPCFWHRTIITSDLGSHVYNAWLAQLIRHGQAPGLWIAKQWTNVLFDLLLSGLAGLFGFAAAEKLGASISVLIFFWGAVALICAATKKFPWFLLPVVALVAYGWTFHMGLLNYYLSLGLAFFALAIFWRGRRLQRLIAIAIAPLVLMAHPFGFMWLVSAAIYIELTERTPLRYQFVWVIVAGASFFAVHEYLWRHSIVEAQPGRFYRFDGLDQLILFSDAYYYPERALLIFAIVSVAVDLLLRRRERGLWSNYSIPLQLYVVAELAILEFPRAVQFPMRVPIALITDRLSTISAILGCCILGAVRPRKWHLAAILPIAIGFFALLYSDTGTINGMELQAEKLVRTLPPGQRVTATIEPLGDSRISIQHLIDRACLGYCFDYGNYEPGSAVFRVRAAPGNPYVIDDYGVATDTEEGDYIVQPRDLPMHQVYQCTDSGTVLCIRPLQAGEENDRLGVHPCD